VHLKRWITGLSALPFLIFLIYKGGLFFISLLTIGCLVSFWEYVRIVFDDDKKIHFNPIIIWGYLISLVIIWGSHFKGLEMVLTCIALNLVISACISVFQYDFVPDVIGILKKQMLGVIHIPVLLSFLTAIRDQPQGMTWIFFMLSIIFAGDITALYAGTFLGRHKLCPAVSPGKTVEGSIGGLVANVTVGAIAKYFFLAHLPWSASILFFLAIGLAGQAGDLYESALKRSSQVKDSGGLLPGHGGFLDRIDALLFAAPVAYLFKVYIF
jgi:phosphatidate cytidylyltransferase